jgi:hypothetical protein
LTQELEELKNKVTALDNVFSSNSDYEHVSYKVRGGPEASG